MVGALQVVGAFGTKPLLESSGSPHMDTSNQCEPEKPQRKGVHDRVDDQARPDDAEWERTGHEVDSLGRTQRVVQ